MASFTSDIQSLLPDSPAENRRAHMTKLAMGFAAAVLPVGAQTITTDTKGLIAGEIQIPTADVNIPGYRACPDKGSQHPIVLVVQEIFGVHEHIKDLCRRLGKSGYCAVAPALYARQGDVSKIENINDIISKVVARVPDSQVMSDLDATAAWAAKNSRGNANRLAITGYCWGGRIVWMYASRNPKLKAGAAWYGRIEGDKNPMTPSNPIDIAGSLKAPVLGLYGSKDTGIPISSLEKMRASLTAVKDKSEIVIYPQAEHGFNADYRPSYNKDAATDAWAKMLAHFKKHGV